MQFKNAADIGFTLTEGNGSESYKNSYSNESNHEISP
jgi:hypothetical protein